MPRIPLRDLLQYLAWAIEVFSHFMKTPPPPSSGGSSDPSTSLPPTPERKPPEPPKPHIVRNGTIVLLLGCTVFLLVCLLCTCMFGVWVGAVRGRAQAVPTVGQTATGGPAQAPERQETPTPSPTATASPADILRQWGYNVILGDGCQVSPPINSMVTVVKKTTGFYPYCEVVYQGGPKPVETLSEAGQGLLPPDGQRYSITRATFRAP